MTQEWTGTFSIKQNWAGTFDVTQDWAGTFDVTQAWSGTVDVYVESFTGAYDDTDLFALYAMRLGLTSYYGSPLIRVRRSSDNAEDDIGHLSNGDLDTAAVADFIGGGSASIVTLYEQKNGNHATQATAAAQPLYVASGQNSRPVMRFDGTDDYLDTGVTEFAQLSALIAYANRSGSFGTLLGTADRLVLQRNTRVWFDESISGIDLPDTLNSSNLLSLSFDYTNDDYFAYLDGALQGSDTTSATTQGSSAYYIGRRSSLFVEPLNGDVLEVVLANATWSTAERTDAEQIANDYWGVF